jgi:hypothetical protein
VRKATPHGQLNLAGCIVAPVFGSKEPCECGCGSQLKGQARGFSRHAANIRHLVDGLTKVVEPFVPADAAERGKLDQMKADGHALEADLFSVAHGEQGTPRYSVADIDSWMAAATGLVGGRARAMAEKGIDPAATTGWKP